MEGFKLSQLTFDILAKANIGLWAIEIDEDKPSRMYADDTMLGLLGIKGKKTPEQVFDIWYSNIDDKHYDVVTKTINKMKTGVHAEAQYPWHSPKGEVVYVRCGGILNKEYKKGFRFEGIHQDITEMVHIQMKTEKQEIELQEVKKYSLKYTAIAQALCADFECVYYVDIKNCEYKEYSSHGKYKDFKLKTEGNNFFDDFKDIISKVVYLSDRRRLSEFMKKENIMKDLKEKCTLCIRYRLIIDGKPEYYQLSAVPALDEDENHYIFALKNVEDQVKKETEYNEKIRAATEIANRDALTGVKNRLAYENAEEVLNEEIKNGTINPFAIAVFDLNNLKETNDRDGHEAGDELLCNASKLICHCFTHSPVYRIGGDEFVVILVGADFFDRDCLLETFKKTVKENIKNNQVVVAVGLSDYDFNKDALISNVFDRADSLMYENKKQIKSINTKKKK